MRRRRLLLVRDRFGVKPLYIARHAGGIWFASEMRALLAAGVPARVRPDALRHSVFNAWVNGPHTPIEAIDRLLPGTYLEIDLDSLAARSSTWYDPVQEVDVERSAALDDRSRAEALDMLEATLRGAVRRRLMGDCPIGTMCSGGIDSSLVAAFARDEQPGIHAFNAAIVDQPEVNEAAWAELVAGAHDLELHTANFDEATWRAGFVAATLHNEFPLVHPGTVPMASVAELAAADGVKVLLSGEGADELFGGYAFLHGPEYAAFQIAVLSRLGQANAHIRRLLGRQRGATRQLLRALGRDLPPGRPQPDRFDGPCAAAVAYVAEVRARAGEGYRHHAGRRRALEAALATDLSVYLPHLLNRQDKNTMQFSVETRVPFLDPEVVGFVLNLPLEFRVLPQRKGILRELAARRLPKGIAERPKIGFGFPIKRYFRTARPEFLLDGHLRQVLEISAEEWIATATAANEDLSLLLWSAEVWCRGVLDGATPDEIDQSLWLEPIRIDAAPSVGSSRRP
jgi:asparagine synthase (glutamine-hydrolysing)